MSQTARVATALRQKPDRHRPGPAGASVAARSCAKLAGLLQLAGNAHAREPLFVELLPWADRSEADGCEAARHSEADGATESRAHPAAATSACGSSRVNTPWPVPVRSARCPPVPVPFSCCENAAKARAGQEWHHSRAQMLTILRPNRPNRSPTLKPSSLRSTGPIHVPDIEHLTVGQWPSTFPELLPCSVWLSRERKKLPDDENQ